MLNSFRLDLLDGMDEWIDVELIFSGCRKGLDGHLCPGCHNPELWEFLPVPPRTLEKLETLCRTYVRERIKIDGIVCIGGEPLDQPDLYSTIDLVKSILGEDLPVFIYTGYSLEYIRGLEMTGDFPRCDFLKIGPYDPSCPPKPGSKLASGNQQVFSISNNMLGAVVPF